MNDIGIMTAAEFLTNYEGNTIFLSHAYHVTIVLNAKSKRIKFNSNTEYLQV